VVTQAVSTFTPKEEDAPMSPNKSQAAELRELIARNLSARHGKVPVQVSAIIRDVRSASPGEHFNDAELTHLIVEGAIQRGLDVNFDGGSQAHYAVS
jgi:hypothetical protein